MSEVVELRPQRREGGGGGGGELGQVGKLIIAASEQQLKFAESILELQTKQSQLAEREHDRIWLALEQLSTEMRLIRARLAALEASKGGE